jgi:catechol 2,3-dioxygenase-like lactoylglutathione lyase family enzyme
MSNDAFPIISVDEMLATQRFYQKLGFRQAYRFPQEGDPEFVTMTRGSSTIGIGQRRTPSEEGFGYWVYVDDVDRALTGLREGGAPVVGEPEDLPWGERVARTRDPAGNLVYLGAIMQ